MADLESISHASSPISYNGQQESTIHTQISSKTIHAKSIPIPYPASHSISQTAITPTTTVTQLTKHTETYGVTKSNEDDSHQHEYTTMLTASHITANTLAKPKTPLHLARTNVRKCIDYQMCEYIYEDEKQNNESGNISYETDFFCDEHYLSDLNDNFILLLAMLTSFSVVFIFDILNIFFLQRNSN